MQPHLNSYVTLIDRLISCTWERVNQLLQENTELLNIHLIENAVAIAEQLLEAEDEEGARYFFSIAQQIAQLLAEMEMETSSTIGESRNITQFCKDLENNLDSSYLYAVDN